MGLTSGSLLCLIFWNTLSTVRSNVCADDDVDCRRLCSGQCDLCDRYGKCYGACRSGYYGERCDLRCSSHCKSGVCNGNCECEPGYYQDGKCYGCSTGCKTTCNSDSGTCTCKDWWDGSKCTVQVVAQALPSYGPTTNDHTTSSVVVTWRTISSLPDNVKPYYSYVLVYRLKGVSAWTVVGSLAHEPSAGGTQQHTLTDLQYNTAYQVQVRSVRSLRGLTSTTGSTPVADFTTECKAPSKPGNLQVTHQQNDNKITLLITWQTPDSGCTYISGSEVKFRLSSTSDSDWQTADSSSGMTSATIPDLEPGEYIVRVTVTNNQNLDNDDTKTYTAFLDTNCSKCVDSGCVPTYDCQTCQAGYKLPKCRNICDPGKYGVNCAEDCSEGCGDTCHHVSGTCTCRQWWTGNKCNTEIKALGVFASPPTASSLTDSSAEIRWNKITNLPAGLSDHYQYIIEYKEEASSSWVEWQTRHSHDPSPDQYQEATLTGLMYNTVYGVRVKSFRVLADDREETGTTVASSFKTRCREPDKPVDLQVTHEGNGKKITLVVTWQTPDSGCSYISGSEIKFRLSSTSGFVWQTVGLSAGVTSATIPDLEPGEYIVRVTVTNNQDLDKYDTKTYTALLEFNTDCDKCVDSSCMSNIACQICQAGYKLPECRNTCDPGNYGVNCDEECGEGCEDICDSVSGTCSCQMWWKGNKCNTEIKDLGLPSSPPTASSVTDSSAVIQWQKIPNVPAGLSDHYQYVIEYKEETSSNWVEWQTRHSHDPSPDQYQEATLTGLMYNTVYDVRVKSFRVLGGDREDTGTTDNTLRTKCRVPSVPTSVSAIPVVSNGSVTLTITWKHPQTVGCNKLEKYDIMYRLVSSDDWMPGGTVSASYTSHSVTLSPADYVVRIVVTNDGGLPSLAETTYESSPGGETDSLGIGLIVGIAIGSLVCIVLVGVAIGCLLYRTRRSRPTDNLQSDSKTTSQNPNDLKKQGPKSAMTNLEETPENQYEVPHIYENANEVMKPSEYETLP